MNSFAELGLSKQALVCLETIGFTEPTEIQVKAIGPMLNRCDVMASAQTGSGKTAAYVLPMIDRLAKRTKKVRALVLVPTRELAMQVKVEFERFGSHAQIRTTVLYGGTGYERQTRELRAGPDVIVATPGRLLDMIQRRMVDLSMVEMLILDEADRLMDFGFMPQIRNIVEGIPKQRQTAMFSATFDQRVERLSKDYLINPVRMAVQSERLEPSSIDQQFHKTNEPEKEALLLEIISDAGTGSVLVFTKTRRKAKKVAANLRAAAIQAYEIHGDVSQNQRERTLERYRSGKFTVLVATDVAARGLDIPTISHVVNYDLPQSPEDYVHRIGRTGRAGRAGCSHTFVCDSDRRTLRDIEKVVGRTLMTRSSSPVRKRPDVSTEQLGDRVTPSVERGESFGDRSVKPFGNRENPSGDRFKQYDKRSKPSGDWKPAGRRSRPSGEHSQGSGEWSKPSGEHSQGGSGKWSKPSGERSRSSGDWKPSGKRSSKPSGGEWSKPSGRPRRPSGDSTQAFGEHSDNSGERSHSSGGWSKPSGARPHSSGRRSNQRHQFGKKTAASR